MKKWTEEENKAISGRELRAVIGRAVGEAEGEEKRVSGLGIVYDRWVEIWPGYRERIRKGAVERAPIVKSYFNHDPSQVLSTTESKPPLRLRDLDDGLHYSSPIPPTSYGRDLEVNLERQNVVGSSFAFDVPPGGDQRWDDENGIHHRDISRLLLYEIGPVTDPAYVMTTAGLRSTKAALEEWRKSQPPSEPVARLIRERRQRLLELDA